MRGIVGLALTGLVLAPSATGAAQLDTVTATGSSGPVTPPVETRFGLASLFDIDVNAHSGTSGQDPGGTASFTFGVPAIGGLSFSGPVTCLSVTGPDRGAGTATEPTTASVRFQDAGSGVLVMLGFIDNGGNGADTVDSLRARPPARVARSNRSHPWRSAR
jgi:hypothetical protein